MRIYRVVTALGVELPAESYRKARGRMQPGDRLEVLTDEGWRQFHNPPPIRTIEQCRAAGRD